MSEIIDHACTNIFLEHGSYGNEDCISAIEELQVYLINSLPITIFEHLAENRNELNRRRTLAASSTSSSLLGYSHHNQFLLWSKDPRIKLSIFLHPHITRFNIDGKGNELMLMEQNESDGFSGGMGGLDELFLCAHIRRLVNLTHLNLYLITTDEILLLVGAMCKKLEVANIVSRIKQENFHNYSGTFEHPQQQQQANEDELENLPAAQNVLHPPHPQNHVEGVEHVLPNAMHYFPVTTFKFCVSDVGLQALELGCKLLKRITMNKISNHSPAQHGISVHGVRGLIIGLPQLEFINFGSIGKILQHHSFNLQSDRLKLTHFCELDPNFVKVDRLQILCPNIQHVSLSVPLTVSSHRDGNDNHSTANIMDALANSSLPLKTIELQQFPYCDSFKRLLKLKGKNLMELRFRANISLNSKHITFIGESCPKLQKLQLKEIGPDDTPNADSPPVIINTTALRRQSMFSELISVDLSGQMWNPNSILPIILTVARKLSRIKMGNTSYRGSMDSAVLRLLSCNKLEYATAINLYSGCFLSMEIIRRLSFSCPRLNCFSFMQSNNVDMSEVERLRIEMAEKNLDIKLCCLEMFEV